jgi:hypothetical protein
MKIVKLVRWDRSEVRVFRDLERWTGLYERANLDEDEIKSLGRLIHDPHTTKERLLESVAVWKKLREVMQTQLRESEIQSQTLPETAAGIIARPKQMAVAMSEAAESAIADITKAILLVVFAIGLLEGDLSQSQLLDVDKLGVLEFHTDEADTIQG